MSLRLQNAIQQAVDSLRSAGQSRNLPTPRKNKLNRYNELCSNRYKNEYFVGIFLNKSKKIFFLKKFIYICTIF
ncbi:MAG: hypothetical protein EAZ85_15320 [Bacteroidetes bacterium]|nr:MAG: hypothetical protein EAZ85_15320 [Bacteroidota bacterium]TAG85115.1 MAG: hypothetical protein EAZ20_15995 [Bacteroidota bacterium]